MRIKGSLNCMALGIGIAAKGAAMSWLAMNQTL
jgi:hypothetical protein